MKIFLVFIIVINSLAVMAQDQFKFDIEKLRKDLEFNKSTSFFNRLNLNQKDSVLYLRDNGSFNEFKYSKRLLSSLENYNLVNNPLDTFNSNRIFINFENIGKKHFDDVHENYKNDLSKYIPPVPDIFWLCPIY